MGGNEAAFAGQKSIISEKTLEKLCEITDRIMEKCGSTPARKIIFGIVFLKF